MLRSCVIFTIINLSSFCSRLLPFVPVFGPRVKSETCLLLVLSHFYFHQNSLVATVRLLSFLDYLCVYTICCLPSLLYRKMTRGGKKRLLMNIIITLKNLGAINLYTGVELFIKIDVIILYSLCCVCYWCAFTGFIMCFCLQMHTFVHYHMTHFF